MGPGAGRARGRRRGVLSPQVLRAVLRLRDMILNGDVRAGERIPELKLVQSVGTSRTPLRLAMERLEHEGLLARRPSGGFVVREFSFAEVRHAIELRGTLEGLACRFAAECPPPVETLRSIRETMQAIEQVLRVNAPTMAAFVRYVELNERFHEQLIGLADNALLGRLLDQVRSLPFASPSAFVLPQATSPESHRLLMVAQEQHRTMLEAIASRDSARAEALAREHARLALRNLDLAARDRESFSRLPGGRLVRFSEPA